VNALNPTTEAGLVSVQIGGQTFGVPVLEVQDVIAETAINRVPLAPPEIAGSLNLRGRIVTAIDMRRRLGLPPQAEDQRASGVSVIVEQASGELYALMVDDVGDVLWLPPSAHEPTPPTLSPAWRDLCDGLYRLETDLMLVLRTEAVLTLASPPVGDTPDSTRRTADLATHGDRS
jgi:purine-binding chemotaxis protein CheW